MPRFLIDENLPHDLTEISRESGFRSRWVRDIEPGISDGEILRDVLASGETLVTRDIGFANMVFARMALDDPVAGVVLIKEERMHRIREAWN